MFTGLIQSLGNLTIIDANHLRIECIGAGELSVLDDIAIGDSVAVDGVCLTVETLVDRGFVATASPETLARTTLGHLAYGAVVNLESSLRVGSKIGGHFVTGHVDGLGIVERVIQTSTSWEFHFQVPTPKVAQYIVEKGSIAINGISLTVANCSDDGTWFSIAVIPVTYGETNLQYLESNQPVNLEGDILAKYAEKFLTRNAPMVTASGSDPASISLSFLSENGYT